MITQRMTAPLLAVLLGALVWAASPAVTGDVAPWLSPAYFVPAMVFAGAASTLPDHRCWWGVALGLWIVNPVAGSLYCVAGEGFSVEMVIICLLMTTYSSIMFGLWIPGLVGAFGAHRFKRARARSAP
jgi:hypothetical protein